MTEKWRFALNQKKSVGVILDDANATRRHKRRTSHLIFKSKVTKPCEQHKAIFLGQETFKADNNSLSTFNRTAAIMTF